jgi:hypothetical protein
LSLDPWRTNQPRSGAFFWGIEMVKSSIDRLAPEVREMIRARLYEQGFTGYVALADELRGMGLSVSKSALGRYGKRLESEVRSAEVLQLVGGRGHGE